MRTFCVTYQMKKWLAIMLLGVAVNGLVTAQNTHVQLIINPKPVVDFSFQQTTQAAGIVDFTDLSTVNPGSVVGWTWFFGDGSISNEKNPSHTFAASGNYPVKLIAETQSGCFDSIVKNVFVDISLSAQIAVNNPIQCLSGNSFAFSNTVSAPAGTVYSWAFGDGTVSSEASPTHIYTTSGTFDVRLILSAAAPSTDADTAYLAVTVVPTPNVAAINHVYCSGEEVPAYYFTGDVPGTTYQWHRILGQDMGIGLDVTSGVDSIPAFTAENDGLRYLSPVYRVTPYYTANGLTCAGTGQNFLITVNPVPGIAEVADQVHCAGEQVGVYTFTGNIPDAHYDWRYLSGDNIQGLPKTGINQMPAYLAVNNTHAELKATYEVVPAYSFANKTCYGPADTFAISIQTAASVTLASRAQACSTDPEAVLSCVSNNPSLPVYYKITFSEAALAAGFSNMSTFALLTDTVIRIAIPANVRTASYLGHLTVQNNCASNGNVYDFVIDIMNDVTITQQPQSENIICEDSGFLHLEVKATGANLTYQWYRNGLPIFGATTNVFEKENADASYYGTYTVEVTGSCGSVMSNPVEVKGNDVFIMVKWDDVLFVSRRDSAGNRLEIKSFQWYRVYDDGRMLPILEKGHSQYYAEKGLSGTFAVEVTYSDGTKRMSCPYTLIPVGKGVIRIYPNPGQPNEKISVMLDFPENIAKGSEIEIFDVLGRLVEKRIATEAITEFYLNVPRGTYVFRIKTPDGTITTEKVILK